MKIKADYHVHSDFSADSSTPMETTIEQAISLGLDRICFTDHMDYDYPDVYLEDGKPFEFNVEEYITKLDKLQEKYNSQIKIHKGIELGIKPELSDRLNHLVEAYPFDFVIASSHLLDNHDPYYPAYWKTIHNDAKLGIRRYFESITENVKSFQNFDVYGHLDYIVRYAPGTDFIYQPEQFIEQIDTLLKTIITAGKGIEINTAGLKYGLPFAHPHNFLLERYVALGGTLVTIGSDAHKPEHLAYGFDKIPAKLQACGISNYYVFENRQAIPVT